MTAELIHIFESMLGFIENMVGDLEPYEMTLQPAGIPNHALWTLGHVIYCCQGVAGLLGIEEWLPGDWESRYGYGSTPSADLQEYPTRAEMLQLLHDAARRLRRVLAETPESALEEPLPDPDLQALLPTVGHALLQILVAHTAYHAGQLAVWRHALGKPAAGVFI